MTIRYTPYASIRVTSSAMGYLGSITVDDDNGRTWFEDAFENVHFFDSLPECMEWIQKTLE